MKDKRIRICGYGKYGKKLNIRIDEELLDLVAQASKIAGKDQSTFVREAIQTKCIRTLQKEYGDKITEEL